MRWEFIGGEDATLGEALRALSAARGWGEEEAARLWADFAPLPERPGAPGDEERPGEPPPLKGPAIPTLARLREFLRGRPEYQAARGRIQSAGMGHRIVLFGDYDADGITSLVQVHRFLVAALRLDVSWFVPDRIRHGYGLTMEAVDECLTSCRNTWSMAPALSPGSGRAGLDPPQPIPGATTSVNSPGRDRRKNQPKKMRSARAPESPILLIALDCGSTSLEAIAELRAREIDCIVVDHHQPPDLAGAAHPSIAHLNPHAWEGDHPDLVALRLLSAAGLAYCFCAALAHDLQAADWDDAAGLVLAGLGTVADVVPLTGPNRSLVQAALRYANEKGFLAARLPGLARLHELSGGGGVDARTFGYRWGPRLNAPGRIEDARQPAELLLTRDPHRIEQLAAACERANDARKARTAEVLDQALQLVKQRQGSGPPDRVLVLWDESWQPGVVGIVAGRLCEQLRMPAILFGMHRGQQVWKGSGRSVGDYDLGAEVRRAVEAGLVVQGGGHRQAAGLTVAAFTPRAISPADRARTAETPVRDAAGQAEVSLDPGSGADSEVGARGLMALRDWLNKRCTLDARDLEPVHEVLTTVHTAEAWDRAAQAFRDPSALVKFWCDLYDRLEPFGAGNPRPGLLLLDAELVDCQAKTTTKGVRGSEGTKGSVSPPAPVPRVWALSARFQWNGGHSLVADWTDPEAACVAWATPPPSARGPASRARYDLILEPHRSAPAAKDGRAARTWHDWRVVACVRREPSR